MKNTNEKADNIIMLQMVFENQSGGSVIADYMDVFVLLCFIIWLRNLDNLLNINNIYFSQMVHKIHPAELQLNKHNSSDTEAPF